MLLSVRGIKETNVQFECHIVTEHIMEYNVTRKFRREAKLWEESRNSVEWPRMFTMEFESHSELEM